MRYFIKKLQEGVLEFTENLSEELVDVKELLMNFPGSESLRMF